MNWGPVYFMRPEWLKLLIVLPLAWWIGRVALGRRKRAFAAFAAEAAWLKVAPELDWRAPARKFNVWLLAIFFALLALSRPQWGKHEETVRTTGLDVMLVLDVSKSMETEDVVPSRLKKSKHFVRTLADRARGDRLGIVAFAGSAHLAAPLTTDIDFVLETVDSLGPTTVANQGTDIGAALETAARALDRGAEQGKAADANLPSTRVVVLISDGEDFENEIATGAKKIRDAGVQLYVFGVGTDKGGPIPVRDASGQNYGYKRDRKGQTVVSRFNSDSLRKLASEAGGRYWTMTPAEGELDQFLEALNSHSRSEFDERKIVIRHERYQWPLAIAILLLLLELTIPARKLLALAILATGLVPMRSARASDLGAYWENRKGIEAFEKGEIPKAKEHFGAAQVADPDAPESTFNQGVVQMKDGDGESSAKAFALSAENAAKRQDAPAQGRALYNRGIALTQKKDLAAAADSYVAALDAARAAGDADLEAKIRKNLELLAQEAGQGKSEDSKDKDSSDQQDQSQENQDGKKSGSGQDEKKQDQKEPGKKDEKDDQQPKDPKLQQSKQVPFQSQKLSKEDADRVMSELARREQDLQERLRRRQGRPQALEKDW